MASFRKTGRCADVGSPGAELRNEANCGGASQGAGCFHPGYAGTTLDNQKRRDSVKIAAMLWKKPRLRSRSAIGNNGPIEFVNRSGADGPPRPSYLGKRPAAWSKDVEQVTGSKNKIDILDLAARPEKSL